MRKQQLLRQGDVLLEPVESIPGGLKAVAKITGKVILAYGEATGHSHVMDGHSTTLFSGEDGIKYALVSENAPAIKGRFSVLRWQDGNPVILIPEKTEWGQTAFPRELCEVISEIEISLSGKFEALTHIGNDHSSIAVPPGTYRLPGQREYTPQAIRNVAD